MTLTATTIKSQFNGDGATTSFPVGFVFWDADDVRVVLTDTNGEDTEWTRGTQFELPDGDGGTETLTVNTLPTDFTPQVGEKLTILSALPNTQGTSLPLGGPLPSTAVEQRLDQITRLIQQRSEELDRTPKFGVSEAESSHGDIPALESRKSKFLAFDADGVPVAAAGTSADLGPVSSFIDTLLDDADAATARATLGAPAATDGTLTNPTITGGTQAAPVINSATGIGQSIVKRKTADESVTSSITPQDDDHLIFPVGANEEWVARYTIFTKDNVAATGVRVAITVPSGASLLVIATVIGNASSETDTNRALTSGSEIRFNTAQFQNSTWVHIVVDVWVLNSSTSGNITLQWCQDSSSATALTFLKGSFLVADRIA